MCKTCLCCYMYVEWHFANPMFQYWRFAILVSVSVIVFHLANVSNMAFCVNATVMVFY